MSNRRPSFAHLSSPRLPRVPTFSSLRSTQGSSPRSSRSKSNSKSPWADEFLAQLEKTHSKFGHDASTDHVENIDLEAGFRYTSTSFPATPRSTEKSQLWTWRKPWRGNRPTAYKVLFFLCLLVNVVTLLQWMARGLLGPDNAMIACSCNLFLALLIRNEFMINTLYETLSRIAFHAPHVIKRHIADFHHYGGVHTGLASSAVFWYIQYSALQTMEFAFLQELQTAVSAQFGESASGGLVDLWSKVDLAMTYFIIALLLFICVTALPVLRRRYHNLFERTHRFGGWVTIAALWIHTIGQIRVRRLDSIFPNTNVFMDKPDIWTTPSFYFLIGTTALLIFPWLFVRRVRVFPKYQRHVSATLLPQHTYDLHLSVTDSGIELQSGSTKPAKKNIVESTTLIFPYPSMPPTSTMRFSTSPLLEWHAFATIPSESTTPTPTLSSSLSLISEAPTAPNLRHHVAKILVARTGDWTAGIIRSPPPSLWIRASPVSNFLTFARCWDRILLVATGAGIGPIVSCLGEVLAAQSRVPSLMKVLWCARAPFATAWADTRRTIQTVDPGAWILDTSLNSPTSRGRQGKGKGRRPDLLEESRAMIREYGVQAVFVVSNKGATDIIVKGLKRVGVPAYGAVFDS